MSNSLVNMRDLQFVLYEHLGIERLFETEQFADYSKETVDMVVGEAEKLAVEAILPTYVAGDKEGVTFKDGKVLVPASFHDAYKKFIEGGWLCCMRAPGVGGQGMPQVVSSSCYEFFNAANVPFTMYPDLTNGAAALIDIFGTEEQKQKYMCRMYSGEWGGTMCLTESGAGSDVGALKTSAKRLPDGTYSITGTKIFISSGDHDLCSNIVEMVLARIEGDPHGTEGISIFIVPKYKVNADGSLGELNDLRTGNVEHKLGIKSSATCTLHFGDEGNCVGELLGKEREGLKIMLHLMNEARLEVGIQALGISSAAYEHTLEYAKGRIQGCAVWEITNPDAKPVTIINHPDIRRTLLWMKAHVEGIRAITYYTAYCIDLAEVASTPEERERWKGMVELLTPVCKAYSSAKAFQICSSAIDVYGGYGYCSEYPIEQYLRDCKVTSIYEGTNGIQALDLVGRKLGMKKGANAVNLFMDIMATISEVQENEELKAYNAFLEEAATAVSDLTRYFGQVGKSAGFLIPVLYATPYLEIFGDVVVGRLLMQQAAIAADKLSVIYAEKGATGSRAKQRALVHDNADVAFYTGKIAAAKFFALNILTTVKSRCAAIRIGDKTAIELADESFGG
jgi:hypothetical protein